MYLIKCNELHSSTFFNKNSIKIKKQDKIVLLIPLNIYFLNLSHGFPVLKTWLPATSLIIIEPIIYQAPSAQIIKSYAANLVS